MRKLILLDRRSAEQIQLIHQSQLAIWIAQLPHVIPRDNAREFADPERVSKWQTSIAGELTKFDTEEDTEH